MKPRRLTIRTAGLLVGLAIALLIPALLGSNQYNMMLATTILLYAAMATAWNIIGGMAGQMDLAATAYLGLGAFTAGTLLIKWDISPWIGMVLGGLVAAGFAALVGYSLFRFGVKEVWYALSSSALVEVLRVAFLLWEDVGGPVERYLPFHRWSLYHMRFSSYVPYYYIMLVLLLMALLVNYRIARTRLGYYLKALGENEDAAEVLGVDARACKLKALMIYAFLVGAVGAVYACLFGFIHPNIFSGLQGIEVAVLGIVGGMGIIYGPLIAALILVSGREFLRANLSGQVESLYLAVYAAALILIALFRPQGIATLFQGVPKGTLSRTAKEKNVQADHPNL